jgi:hypothetical protein
MDIIIAKIINDEGNIIAVEIFDTKDGGDFTEILDFFVHTKAEFGHKIVNRRSTQILFTDGIRVFLESGEIMEMSNVTEFNRIKEIDGKRVSQPTNGIVLEPKSTTEES